MTAALLLRPLTASDLRAIEAIEAITRREFVVGGAALAALLAASCGSDDAASPAPTTAAPTATRTWSLGPQGPVEVPTQPQRVVVGNSIDADYALVLGLPLVGVPGTLGVAARPFADYHADLLAGVERVQTGAEPNLEQVLALAPDVILDSWDVEQARYDGFARIAPTVNFAPVLYPGNFARTDWQAALTALGELFGREQQAADAIAEYDRVIAEGRERLAPLAGKTFAPVNGFGAEGAGIIDQGQQISQVASDLGLVPFELVSATPADRVTLSLEELGRLEGADHLLFARYPAEESLERESANGRPVLDSPLWKQLPAVTGGRVVDYLGELYYASPITAVKLAEHLVDRLAPGVRS